MDESCVRALFDRLTGDEPPPSRVDIRLASRVGRRRLRWRRGAAPGASALAIVVVAGLISTSVITLGPRVATPGVVRPERVLNPFAPYATFGWLPRGFSLPAGNTISWLNEATTQSTQVSAGSPATQQVISLTANSADSCAVVRQSTFPGGSRERRNFIKRYEKRFHREPPVIPPYENTLMCSYGNGGGGSGIGSVVGEIDGSPAYGIGSTYRASLTWQYAKGSWAQIGMGLSASAKRRQASDGIVNASPSAYARLLRVADNVRFGGVPESFAFRLSGIPKSWRQYTTDYDNEAGGRTLNETLWFGPGDTTNGNAIQITIRLASRPMSCGWVKGQTRYETVDGIRFNVQTTAVPEIDALQGAEAGTNEQALEGSLMQELCGYTDHLQVNIGVALQALHSSLSSLTGTTVQTATATVFRHLTLLGPAPADWTTHPLS
jgi:hypothetical protein